MYASNRTQDQAALSAARKADQGFARETLAQAVGLPALAAAVHAHAAEARVARERLAARQAVRIVHEDEPTL